MQYFGNLVTNVRLFLGRDFHMDSGMKYLIESFYRSIREEAPVPIPYREILLTARIMDAIFEQLNASRSQDHLNLEVDRIPAGKLASGIGS
jgi:predicted dehydrogenase